MVQHVPSTRFLTALTAYSTRVLRACCIPLPTVRFVPFPTGSVNPPGGDLNPARLSRDAAHTLRRIPLVSSRTASPRPLPSCRFRSLRRRFVSAVRLGSRGHLGCASDPKATCGSLPLRSRAGLCLLLLGPAPILVRPKPLEWSQTPTPGLVVRQSISPYQADLSLPCSRRDRASPLPVARPGVPHPPPRWLAW
jgi:hypothetical protein